METERGRFTGIGDASPQNVSRGILPHAIRMAETRAKARAMRDATNVDGAIDGDVDDTGYDDPNANANANANAAPEDDNVTDLRGAARRAKAPDPQRARKPQVDTLKWMAVAIKGNDGVEKLEEQLGKKLSALTRGEADEWIARLEPHVPGGHRPEGAQG